MKQCPGFPETLKIYRKRWGFTQAEAAELLGYSKETIKAWECGRRYPKSNDIARLAQILETDPQILAHTINESRAKNYMRRMYEQSLAQQITVLSLGYSESNQPNRD
jgi:transcriptional regulator with XRE-family HTH domain